MGEHRVERSDGARETARQPGHFPDVLPLRSARDASDGGRAIARHERRESLSRQHRVAKLLRETVADLEQAGGL